MNDNDKTHCVGLGLLKSAGDFLLAVGVVIAACWGLLQAAHVMENRPIRPGMAGDVVLPAWKATLEGSVAKCPDDLERQTTDFAYHYGRELHTERVNRTIGRWQSTTAHVEWSFRIDNPGTYAIELEYACPADEAGSEFVVFVSDRPPTFQFGPYVVITYVDVGLPAGPASPALNQQFVAKVASTGSADVWKTTEVGRVKFASAGVYGLRIQARTIAHENLMNLKQVALSSRQ